MLDLTPYCDIHQMIDLLVLSTFSELNLEQASTTNSDVQWGRYLIAMIRVHPKQT